MHRVLATLINVRDGGKALPVERLQERMELVRWLRGELAAVETFLVAEQQRVQAVGPPAAAAPSIASPPVAPVPVEGDVTPRASLAH